MTRQLPGKAPLPPRETETTAPGGSRLPSAPARWGRGHAASTAHPGSALRSHPEPDLPSSLTHQPPPAGLPSAPAASGFLPRRGEAERARHRPGGAATAPSPPGGACAGSPRIGAEVAVPAPEAVNRETGKYLGNTGKWQSGDE